MSIGKRIKEIREILGLNQKEFASTLYIDKSSISQFENNKTKPSIDTLIKLSNTYHVNLQWLLTGKGDMFINDEKTPKIPTFQEFFGSETATIPLGSGIAAGPAEEAYETGEFIQIPKVFIKKPISYYFALPVTGNSMEPEIRIGDIAVIEKLTNWDNLNKVIAAVRMNGEITLKEIIEDKEKKLIILNSYNQKYKPIIISPHQEDIFIVGKLILLIRVFAK